MLADTPQDQQVTPQDTSVTPPAEETKPEEVTQPETPKAEEKPEEVPVSETPTSETKTQEETPVVPEEPKPESVPKSPQIPELPKEEQKTVEKPKEEVKPEEKVSSPEPETPKQPIPAEASAKEGQRNLDELREKANKVRQDKMNQHLEEIQKLAGKKSINNDDVRELLHVAQSTATKYLSILVKQGKLKKSGGSNFTSYHS